MKITVIFLHTAESISAAVVEALEPFIEEVTGNLSQINNLLGNLNDTVGENVSRDAVIHAIPRLLAMIAICMLR